MLSNSTTAIGGVTYIDLNTIVYTNTVSGSNPGKYPFFSTGCMRVTVPAGGQTLYLWANGSSNISINNNPENYFYAVKVQ